MILALALAAAALGASAPARAQDAAASRRYYYEDVFEPFFALNPATGRYAPRRAGSSAAGFSAVKPAGTFRVFVVGGSIAAIYAGRGSLQDALDRALPGRTAEVINCGMPGYDSPREELVLDEVAGYSPDAVVLMSGHNESLDHPWVAEWRLRLNARLPELLRRTARTRRRSAEERAAAAAARLGEFEAALRRMARVAAAKKFSLVLLAPPLNLRDAPSDMHIPLDADFRRGWRRFLLGDCPGARGDWARESGPEAADRSLALFFTGRCWEREGRPAEADAAYLKAFAADAPLSGRCATACRGVLERVAKEEGARLADGDRAMRALAAPRLPGFDLFDDRVHWRPEAHPAVSAAIVEALRREPALAALSWRDLEKPPRVPPRPAAEESWRPVLRYAVSAMNAEPDKLSAVGWLALSRTLERWPQGLADPAGLLERLPVGSNSRGVDWGMGSLPPTPASFYWHLATARLAAGDARDAQQDFLTATRDGASSSWFWSDRAIEAEAVSKKRRIAP